MNFTAWTLLGFSVVYLLTVATLASSTWCGTMRVAVVFLFLVATGIASIVGIVGIAGIVITVLEVLLSAPVK